MESTSREVVCNGICLLMEEFRQFLRIVPEMLGFYSDRSSRIPASIKHLWEVTRYIVWEFQHSTRIEDCKKSLGGLALHNISKNMPRVPKCQFYPSLKMPRVANHPRTHDHDAQHHPFHFYIFIFHFSFLRPSWPVIPYRWY